jgi:hypothetical protein
VQKELYKYLVSKYGKDWKTRILPEIIKVEKSAFIAGAKAMSRITTAST